MKAPGIVLVALGALALAEASRVNDAWPGARLMPAVVGVLLVALGAGHLVQRRRHPAGVSIVWPDPAGRRRVVMVFGIAVAYVALLPAVGLLAATATFVLILLRMLGPYRWRAAMMLAVLVAVAMHVAFKQWLGMPLP